MGGKPSKVPDVLVLPLTTRLHPMGDYHFRWARGVPPEYAIVKENMRQDPVEDPRIGSGSRSAAFDPSADYSVLRGASRTEASDLPRADLCDRIRGVIFGNALGDAIGLSTEFMQRARISGKYPEGFFTDASKFSFSAFHMDMHRMRFVPGDWTDDTDQMIAILESLLCTGGRVEPRDIGRRILYWSLYGFPELHDVAGLGLGMSVGSTLEQPEFLRDPYAAARAAYAAITERTGRPPRANGGVMRTSVLALPRFHDLAGVAEDARAACLVTHPDGQCVASCVAICTAIALLLQGRTNQDDPAQLTHIAEQACEAAAQHLDHSSDLDGAERLRAHALAASLEDLKLDSGSEIGYTFKCMGAGMWALRAQVASPLHGMLEVASHGGDADTNGAVAGAVLGARFGYSALPQHLITHMPFAHWLHLRVDKLLECMGLLDAPSRAGEQDEEEEGEEGEGTSPKATPKPQPSEPVLAASTIGDLAVKTAKPLADVFLSVVKAELKECGVE